MKLKELCIPAGISVPPEFEETEITLPVTDSRKAVSGCLFICINGLHSNGHEYIGEAIRGGAVCILMQSGHRRELPKGICPLEAADTRKACSLIFNAFYGDPASQLKFIGVTGTNGKTSVTHMLRAVLEGAMCRCGLIGTVGCESVGRHLEHKNSNSLANMTTPDPPELYRMLSEMLQDGVEYVLMEVTSHALALGKLEPISFKAGIFTNLTPDHLDFHGSMEQYALAKAELFGRSELSIFNADDATSQKLQAYAKGRVLTCTAAGNRADYRAEAVSMIGRGVDYELRAKSLHLHLQCPIPGSFSVMNSMQAAVCALELGFSPASVKASLVSMSGVRGRMERVKLGPEADFDVWIDYAHTPDALEKLLRTARDANAGRGKITVVFGCGGDRDRSKRPMMGAIAEKEADAVILTADNSRSESTEQILSEILSGMRGERVKVIPDRREAIRYAVFHASKHDLILLAGKGHEEYEINREGRHRFFEREIVAEAFKERQSKHQCRNFQNDSQA